MPLSPIPEILDELRAGRMIVLTDDEHRENEGDLVLPVQFVSPAAITFMLQNALGYLCLSLTEADCDRLKLHPQATHNTSARTIPFARGTSTRFAPGTAGSSCVPGKPRVRSTCAGSQGFIPRPRSWKS